MVKWADKMYFDERATKKKTKIMQAINTGKQILGVYCIVLSTNPNNLLDIINVNELKFPYYKKIDLFALGLAYGRDNAISLVMQMLDEVYQNTGDVKVREYYQDRWDLC